MAVGVQDINESPAGTAIATRPAPDCLLCGQPGAQVYGALRDLAYDLSGQWRIVRCENPACALAWLDPMPTEADIHKAYATYYTHAPWQPEPSVNEAADRSPRSVAV